MAAPPSTMAAAPQNTAKLELDVPPQASPGDKLTFHTAAGQFSLTVPPGAVPGKRMMVTMPVPSTFPSGQQLQVNGLRINGHLPTPKPTSAQQVLTKEHKQRVDGHLARFTPAEKKQVCTHSRADAKSPPRLRAHPAPRRLARSLSSCVTRVASRPTIPLPMESHSRWQCARTAQGAAEALTNRSQKIKVLTLRRLCLSLARFAPSPPLPALPPTGACDARAG